MLFNADSATFQPYHGENKLIFNEMMIFALLGSSLNRVNPKTEISICCFSTKHISLKRKSKDWLARNQDKVLECGDIMSHSIIYRSPESKGHVSYCHHLAPAVLKFFTVYSSGIKKIGVLMAKIFKDYAISMCCFSTKHISLRRTSKDWLSLVVSINEAPALTHNLN
jgi:hypothetical protein